MITILILDDDSGKVARIRETIQTLPEITQEQVEEVTSLIQARDRCRQKQYDLLILDLRLPNREGDEPDDLAGCEFIKELNTSVTILKPYHIIGLTAFDDLLLKANQFFADELWCLIKYDPASANWRRLLAAKLSYLVNSKKALGQTESNNYLYDIGIITALHQPELQSILDLPANWVEAKEVNDSTIYYRGQFTKDDKTLSVIAASAHQMGMAAAAVLSLKISRWFRPRFIVMAGIAAGVKGGAAKLGDILVTDQSWDYESGKHKIVGDNQIFEPDPHNIPLSVNIKEKILQLKTTNAFLSAIENSWRRPKPSGPLQVHVGPVASGASVIENKVIIEHVKAHNRKLIGLDMETYGVFFAAENCPKPRPTAISIKSVCDFADQDKSDNHQAYAAFTSAQYLYRFALNSLCR